MTEDVRVLGAGNDVWRKEDESGENSVTGGPFGANGRIEKSVKNFSWKTHKMREHSLRHCRR